jgi:hypothetical protein
MSGRQGRRPKTLLSVLRHPMGRLFAHHGHHVRVWRVRRHAVLQRTAQGVYPFIHSVIERIVTTLFARLTGLIRCMCVCLYRLLFEAFGVCVCVCIGWLFLTCSWASVRRLANNIRTSLNGTRLIKRRPKILFSSKTGDRALVRCRKPADDVTASSGCYTTPERKGL